MAKCKFCGAEVTIGERCTYCGSKAEGWYYSGEEKKQEWCRDHGVKIEQKKKRVRYSYDLESWLSRYFGGVK